jgi:multidrug efflux pump subunit AcrB
MSGVAGKFFVQFGWTAAIAVFFSLVVARMLTPMMAAYLLAAAKASTTSRAGWALRRLGGLVPAGTGWRPWGHRLLLRLLRPGAAAADRLRAAGRPVADAGLSLAAARQHLRETRAAPKSARAIVEKNPHVKMVYTAIGGGASGSDPFSCPRGAAEVRKATLTINLTPRGSAAASPKQDVERQLREALAAVLPGVQVKVGLGGSNEKYILVLASENGPLLADHARVVERELRTIPGIGAITSTASLVRPELVVRPISPAWPTSASPRRPSPTRAAHRDRRRLRPELAKLNLAQRQVPIVVKLPPRRARISACSNA